MVYECIMETAGHCLAHLIRETGQCQTLSEHCETVSTLAKTYGAEIGISSLAELAGLIHDMGKAKLEFQEYLLSNDTAHRGKINHSTAGAKNLFEKYCGEGMTYNLTSQILALAILSHHSGLIDCIDPDGFDKFSSRIKASAEIGYTESLDNFEKYCYSPALLTQLFQNASLEIEHFVGKMRQVNSDKQEQLFSFGLLSRYC